MVEHFLAILQFIIYYLLIFLNLFTLANCKNNGYPVEKSEKNQNSHFYLNCFNFQTVYSIKRVHFKFKIWSHFLILTTGYDNSRF